MRTANLSILALATLTLPACPGDPDVDTQGTTADTGEPSDSSGAPITSGGPTPGTEPGTTSPADTGTTAPGDTGTTAPGDTGTTNPGDTTSPIDSTTTTGGADTTTGGGDDTTGGDDDTTGGDTDGGDACAWLLRTHVGKVTADHAGDRFTTLDGGGHLALWDTAAGTRVRTFLRVEKADLVGDTLVYRSAGQLHVVDPSDGSELAACDAPPLWGLATDGSYLWTADDVGLSLLELDCGVRWTSPGLFTMAKVVAVADGVHVFDADISATSVQHFAAADGAHTSDPFLGSFANWFVDVPRYWTLQGNAKRIYDLDNSVAVLGADITYGAGTRYFGYGPVRDLDGQMIAVLSSRLAAHGSVVITFDPDNPSSIRLVHMDKPPAEATEPVPVPPCGLPNNLNPYWSFAHGDGAWVVANGDGFVADDQQRRLTVGQIDGVGGGNSGRVAIGTADRAVRVHDVDDQCEVVSHPIFTRDAAAGLATSGDGTVLVTSEPAEDQNAYKYYWGTRFYTLPEGTQFHENVLGDKVARVVDLAVSDDASVWSYYAGGTGDTFLAGPVPSTFPISSGDAQLIPVLAPDGGHVANTSFLTKPGNFEFATAYIVQSSPKELVGVTDGIPLGFIDDEHLLVGRYKGANDSFLGARIVGLDAVDVQETDLPDLRNIHRIATGEIVGVVWPDKHAAIYQPWTGELLWSDGPNTAIVVAGQDLVAVHDGADVRIVKWR